jgi:hypothetical protein
MAYPFAPREKGKVSRAQRCNEVDVDNDNGNKRQTHEGRKVTRKTTGNKTLKS